MKTVPYSLLVDGSNDTGVEKLNPLTVKVFDPVEKQVTTQLLDMCTTSGRDCGTAVSIFKKINSVLVKFDVPWEHCVGFGVDNTSVNVGLRHSIMTHVQQKNSSVYFMGCPCHLIHNIACHASDSFQNCTKFDVEDLCVDIFYWFDKSTKRKGILMEFCEFCDSTYREIIRFINVRWLSLEKAVNRLLQMYVSLQSYFKSESERQARFQRLVDAFDKPITEVYLLFYQSVLPIFTHLNLLFQREDPNIYLIMTSIRAFLQKLLSKFVKVQVIKNATEITTVDYECSDNQLSDTEIYIGLVTKQRLLKLFNEGDISDGERKKFLSGVKNFYLKATSEALKKLPFDDAVLVNARFVDFNQREECCFSCVEFFVSKYPRVLQFTPAQLNALQEEFIDYQLLKEENIPIQVWKDATMTVNESESSSKTPYYRMDVIWSHLAEMKNVDQSYRFKYLSMISKLVLVLPHSNAGEERVFSLIRQNKTPNRSSLNTNGTLSSMMQVKLANMQTCHKWEPSTDLMKASKKATTQYNQAHSTSSKA